MASWCAAWSKSIARRNPAIQIAVCASFLFAAASGALGPGAPADFYDARRLPVAARTPNPTIVSQSRFRDLPLARAFLATEPLEQIEPGIDEDTQGRNDWFMFQRMYGSNSIPAEARSLAWQSQRELQISGFVSPRATPTWTPIGPSPTVSAWFNAWGMTSGRVNSVAVSPVNSQLVLIGSSTGGIWRSADGGDSFSPVSDDQADLEVGYLAFAKSNPSIVYAGMGDTKLGYLGSGVLKSTDEGKTWARVSNGSLPSPGSIAKVDIDAANPNRLFVAQYSVVSGDKVTSSGVYLSTDGGVSWAKTLAGGARDVVVVPGNPRIVYAGLSRIDKDADPAFGLYRSTDSGASWTNVFTAQYELTKRRDVRIAVSPVDPQRVSVYFGGFIGLNADAHLKTSSDGGATWAEQSLATVDIAQLGYNTYLIADPRDALTLYLGSRDVYRSTDGGASWANITHNFYESGFGFTYAPGGSNTHSDQHSLAFSPTDANEFYVGNDGGVSKTTDGGLTFRSLNATLTLSQFIGLALHPTDSTLSFGGTQDNGAQRRYPDSSWHEIVTGDGGHTVIDALDPSIVFMTYVRGDVYRYINDGQSLDAQVGSNGVFGEQVDNARIAFYPPFVGNQVDSRLYFGTWRLFISSDLGGSWLAPAGFADLTRGVTEAGPDVLSAIAVARSNTNVIYTGSAQGRAMASTDGGKRWADITSGLPNRSITSITVDPSNSATAYLTVSGFNVSHVFKTTDTGATWTDISGGLPNVPASTLMIDPVDPAALYLGTDIGVFRSANRGSSWRGFNRGMPPVVVHEFASQKSGLIQVATYGRGAYELTAGSHSPPAIDSATFDGKKHLTISGSGFGEAPQVLINGQDKSDHTESGSDVEIKLFGKARKLALKTGVNAVQIVTSDHQTSNVFNITL
jgi:photosystem II stability/assembly factor-like uncharacterized protein